MVRSSYPLGFRFCPTDIELLKYYLKRKVLGKKFHSNVDFISTIDVYKYEPWDLPDIACPRNGDLKWYFFCPRDRKYGSGQRINRATEKGYWKTTGNARIVTFNDEVVGARRTLIFHMGRAPCGDRTDWVMHEYSLQEKDLTERGVVQDAYFLCEIYQKEGPGPRNGAQYGAPFIEEEWSDGEENIVGLDPFAGPSIPSSVLPSDPNRAVDSSSDASKMMCMGSVSFPLPSETALSINVVLPPLPKIDGILTNGSSAQIPQVADNELLPVLEHFSEEYNMVSTENNIQNVNFHTFEGNSEVLGSEGTGVNHHIAEMNNTDQLNNFGCDIRGGWGADHAPHHMFSSDAPFSFVELIDLPPRLDFPNENVNSEAFDVNSELLCPEEIGIYHHLATLDNMHQPNNFGSDICGGWTADHAPEQISSYDDPFSFMELDDLDKPFNFPAEVIGCSRTDGFYAEPELFSNYQQFYDSADSYRGVMHLPGPSDPSLLQPATSSGFQDPFFLEEDDGVGEILRDVHENSEAALSTVGEVSCNESEPGNKCAKQSSSRGILLTTSRLQSLLKLMHTYPASAVELLAPLKEVKIMEGGVLLYVGSSIDVKAEVTRSTIGSTKDALPKILEESPLIFYYELIISSSWSDTFAILLDVYLRTVQFLICCVVTKFIDLWLVIIFPENIFQATCVLTVSLVHRKFHI